MNVIPIADPADPRVEPYLRVRERDLVGRAGGFIAEGEVVLRVLFGAASRARASSVVAAENRVARLEALRPPADLPIFVASQRVMDAVAGFPIHRGLLAHGLRPRDAGLAALLDPLPPRAIVLALHGVGNHDNMGGLFRNAAAFGADAVILGAGCCDPLYRKAIRVSVGAALQVPFARAAPGDDLVARLAARAFEVVALSPAGAEPVSTLTRPPRVALLLGAEGPGLPAAILQRARTVSIPMAPGWDSLNVATAAAIVLHQLAQAPGDQRPAVRR
jgi:tRNA G18 (ribose-2'-O)-methylase SpoU